MNRLFFFLLSLSLGATTAWAGGLFGPHGSTSQVAPQTIASVGLNNTTFTTGAPSGTVVGAIVTTMAPAAPAFSGSYTLSGPSAPNFAISGNNVVTNGVLSSPGPYSILITASTAAGNVSNSPFTSQTISITGVAAPSSQTISSITLSPTQFVGGSGSAGRSVGSISTVMNPASPGFSGTYTIGGTDASKFAVTGNTFKVGATDVAAGTYVVTITASPTPTNTIYLSTAGASTWTVPADWNNSSNSIEVIGGGGGGSNGNGGAGGGAYSRITNLALTSGAAITYNIGAGGSGAPSSTTGTAGVGGGDTWFNGATLALSSVGAKGGGGGPWLSAGAGGAAASGTGSTKFSGGAGGTSGSNNETGGGGGAAGPNGNGGTGGSPSLTSTSQGGAAGGGGNGGGGNAPTGPNVSSSGTNGGTAQDSTAGGLGSGSSATPGGVGSHGSGGGGGWGNGTTLSTAGGAGGAGVEWDATHGSGGGGGGAGSGTVAIAGGAGGIYGGGGGPGGFGNGTTFGTGGNGASGLIVIRYSPAGSVIPPFTTAAISIVGSSASQIVQSIDLSNTSFLKGSPNGTVVGQISTAMQPQTPLFCGSLAVGGADAASFGISNGQLVTVGVLNGASYSITIVATPADGSIAPKTQPFTITTTTPPPAQTVSSINLTNAQFPGGSGSANATVGTLSASMSPSTPAFSGTFTQDNPNFVISGTTLKVGPADLQPNSYSLNITATPSDSSIPPLTQNKVVTGTGVAGSLITTYTVRNNSASATAAGAAYIAGQGFRRGDLPPGFYPVFRDPITHTPLIQQLSEITTRRENGDDNSIRHVQFGVQLPAIPANGTYTMEIVKQTGTYSANSKQTLAALCAVHDLKLDLTDVRNQDDTVRDSGHMTFDVCNNINNTGRDAPRHTSQGPVFDTYIVRGAPVYATSGNKDPMIYVIATLDLTTSASDQTSLGSVRHVMQVTNPWMNVRAGSAGNPGAPGPAGFASDPQVVSYRPQVLDGATNVLDWSWYDNTMASSSNPVQLAGTETPNGCPSAGPIPTTPTSNGNITMPGSFGDNTIQQGGALRYTTSGTPIAGLTAGRLYFADGVNVVYSGSNANNEKQIHLNTVPDSCAASTEPNYGAVNPTSQGTGNQTFSYRVWHPKFLYWWTLDPTGADNWTNGTARTTSPFLPAFTQSEITYWEQSGLVPALKFVDSTNRFLPNHGIYEFQSYQPLSIGIMGGSNGGGERGPLGLVNDYFAEALVLGTPAAWRDAKLAFLGRGTWSYGTIFDEVTGHPPVINNGHLNADHTASGTPYTDGSLTIPLRPNFADIFDSFTMDGITPPLTGTPSPTYSAYGGSVLGAGRSFGTDHFPSYSNGMYQIFGARYQLNEIYQIAMGQFLDQSIGNQTLPGWEHQSHTVNGIEYYSLADYCCQIRGSAWVMREVLSCAALGDDANWQRSECQDTLESNRWYDEAIGNWVDTGGGNYNNGLVGPQFEPYRATFKDGYVGTTAAYGWGLLRDQLSQRRITKYIRLYRPRCAANGGGIPGGYGDGYYCASFNWVENLSDTSKSLGTTHPDILTQGLGQYFVTDASEIGDLPSLSSATPDGTVTWIENPQFLFLANGDKVKSIRLGPVPGSTPPFPAPDQLNPGIWYTLANVTTLANGSIVSAKIINPNTGTPFTNYTLNGVPMGSGDSFYVKGRPINNPPPSTSFHTLTYIQYADALLTAFKNVGFSVDDMLTKINQRGFDQTLISWPKLGYDPNIVVP